MSNKAVTVEATATDGVKSPRHKLSRRQKIAIGASLVALVAAIVAIVWLVLSGALVGKFNLNIKYYNDPEVELIDAARLNELIDAGESFAAFVYQPMCSVSSGFEEVVDAFVDAEQVHVYKIAFSQLEETPLGESVKFYPSFALYHNGELVDYLEANEDADTERYKNLSDFTDWFISYVQL